jgi:tape measure domain-containing protein
LADFNLQVLMSLRDRLSKQMEKIGKKFEKIDKTVKRVSQKMTKYGNKISKVGQKTSKAIKRVSQNIVRYGEKISKVGQNISKFGSTMFKGLTLPILGFGVAAVKSAADLETLQVSLESMLGSTEKAEKAVKQLVEFTAKTPFQLQGVGKAAKQLLSFGVENDKLQDKLKFLGDIAAGANVPLSDMAAIFGKSKAKGKAMTEELLQLSDRGIPVIDVLSKQLGVSKTAIFEMASKSKISFDILEKALKSMATGSGKFANQMEKQSDTIAGIFSTLKDNIGLSLATIGKTLTKELDLKKNMKDLIKWIQDITKRFKVWAKENPKLLKTILKIVGALAVFGPIALVVGKLVSGFGGLLKFAGFLLPKVVGLSKILFAIGKGAFFAAKGLVKMVIAGGPVVWILTLIGLLAFLIIKNWKKIKPFFKKLWGDITRTFKARIDSMKAVWRLLVVNIKGRWQAFTIWIIDKFRKIKREFLNFIKSFMELSKRAFEAVPEEIFRFAGVQVPTEQIAKDLEKPIAEIQNKISALDLKITTDDAGKRIDEKFKEIENKTKKLTDRIKLNVQKELTGEIKKKIKVGVETDDAKKKLDFLDLIGIKSAIKSENKTEIKIKVASDKGVETTVQSVKQKKGNAKVKISTLGFLGINF